MKSFLTAFKEYRDLTDELNRKLVWNPKTNRWLVTSYFSKKFIEFKGMEVVCSQ